MHRKEKYIAPEVLPVDIRPEGAILQNSPLHNTNDTEDIDSQSDWGGKNGWS